MQLAAPDVTVDEQRAAVGVGKRERQVRRQQRLAVAGTRAGDRDDTPAAGLERMHDGQTNRAERLARVRSEERRVGKECRARWAAEHEKKKRKARDTWRAKDRMQKTRTQE